jgi:hypothetical protein
MTPPEQRFAAIVAVLGDEPGVTLPADEPGERQTFGAGGLKVHDRIFAMLVRGNLVVKLPRERVTALIGSRSGDAFDRGQGRPLKEWVTIPPTSEADWLAVAREALAYVASRG